VEAPQQHITLSENVEKNPVVFSFENLRKQTHIDDDIDVDLDGLFFARRGAVRHGLCCCKTLVGPVLYNTNKKQKQS
jgi:hypothetical protein